MKRISVYFLSTLFALGFVSLIHSAQLPDFSELAEEVSPSVVNISSSKKIKSRSYGNRQDFSDPFFDDFYKRFFGDMPRQDPRRAGIDQEALGSLFLGMDLFLQIIM